MATSRRTLTQAPGARRRAPAGEGGQSAPQIAARIAALIESRSLKPGDRLRELELVQRFKSSRSPVREALRILEARGLVDIAPNRGATIARLSLADLDETLAMRGMMFRLTARRAVAFASREDGAALTAAAEALMRLGEGADARGFEAAHRDFVALAFRIGRCRRIAAFICDTMPGIPNHPSALPPQSPEGRREIAAHLLAFARALAAGDAARAEAEIGATYEAQAELLKALYAALA